jgi:hypothetical protein
MPPCITFEARVTPHSVVTMADAAIRANIWEPHVLTALRALNVPLTAPDTPISLRHAGSGVISHYSTRDAQLKADKALLPLRRALHNDKGKL